MRVSPLLLLTLLLGACAAVPQTQSGSLPESNLAAGAGGAQQARPFDGYLPPMAADVTPPMISNSDHGTYPFEPLSRGIQGCAWIRFDISPAGEPYNIGVASSLPVADFGKAAISAMRNWRFVPAKKNGKPVAIKGAIENFHYSVSGLSQPMPRACSNKLPPESFTNLPASSQPY